MQLAVLNGTPLWRNPEVRSPSSEHKKQQNTSGGGRPPKARKSQEEQDKERSEKVKADRDFAWNLGPVSSKSSADRAKCAFG